MKNKKLNLNSIITVGKYNGKTVNEIIEEDRKAIIYLCQKGFYFEDEVFKKARYKHIIRDEKIIFEFVDKIKQKPQKIYKKDTENIKNIIEGLSTINNSSYDDKENYEDDIEVLNTEFE